MCWRRVFSSIWVSLLLWQQPSTVARLVPCRELMPTGCFCYTPFFAWSTPAISCLPILPGTLPSFTPLASDKPVNIHLDADAEFVENILPWTLQELPDEAFSPLKILAVNIKRVGLMKVSCRSLSHTGATLDTLDLTENLLPAIPSCAFSNLTELRTLQVSKNLIDKIDAFAFVDLSKLEKLDLAANNIADIHREAFEGLRHLAHLYLQRNHILQVEPNVFNSLVSLATIDLSRNKIENLGSEVFANLSRLEMLSISNNPLRNISPTVFGYSVDSLSILDLSNCQLSKDVLDPVLDLEELTELHLGGNRLEAMPRLDSLPRLRLLCLDKNNITAIYGSPFIHNKNLKFIHLDYNGIRTLSSNCLFGLYTVNKLSFTHNQLDSIGLVFQNISESYWGISLNNNRINTISAFAFRNMTYLDSLDLQHNNLSTIDTMAFQGNGSDEHKQPKFNLAYNRLKSLPTVVSSSGYGTNASHNPLSAVSVMTADLSQGGYSDLEGCHLFCGYNESKNTTNISHILPLSKYAFLGDNCVTSEHLCLLGARSATGGITKLHLDNNLIQTIPNCTVAQSTDTLLLSFNQITYLELEKVKMAFGQVKYLSLRGNKIGFIPNVINLTTIRSLDLSENYGLADIDTLTIIANLRDSKLDLSRNGLRRLTTIHLNYIKYSFQINLTSNFLARVPAISVIAKDTVLLSVLLSDNKLEAVHTSLVAFHADEEDSQDGVHIMLSIDLSHSNISTLTDVLVDLSQIQHAFGTVRVHLSHSAFSKLPNCSAVTGDMKLRLEYIDMSSNKIKNLETDESCLTIAKALNLSDNLITKLNRLTTARMMGSLQQLDLSNNRISDIDKDTFAGMELSLVYLDLSFNKLESIFQTLTNLHSLTELYLHGNHLVQPSPMIGPLSILTLRDNPIVCSCSCLWAVNYTRHVDDVKCSRNESKTEEMLTCFLLRECSIADDIFVTMATIKNCGEESYVHLAISVGRALWNVLVVKWEKIGPGKVEGYVVFLEHEHGTEHVSETLPNNATQYLLYTNTSIYTGNMTSQVCVKAMADNGSLVLATACAWAGSEEGAESASTQTEAVTSVSLTNVSITTSTMLLASSAHVRVPGFTIYGGILVAGCKYRYMYSR